MIVICVSGSKFLIKGKRYEAFSSGDGKTYNVNGTWYKHYNFISLEEDRNLKLNSIFENIAGSTGDGTSGAS